MTSRRHTILTASAMNTFCSCQRRYYLAYELGLKEDRVRDALRFGTAFHAALEARANGLNEAGAIESAFATTCGEELREDVAVTLCALVHGYYRAWGGDADCIREMRPEQEFDIPVRSCSNRVVRGFRMAGKMDGLAVLKDGRLALVEHKTTGEDISPTAPYWDRLRNNRQILAYVDAAWSCGWDTLTTVVYDVIRKPTIRQTQKESPTEFGARLLGDCTEVRPEYYFARREANFTWLDIIGYRADRDNMISQIRSIRRTSAKDVKRGFWGGSAWIPCHSQIVCRGCQYRGICAAGARPTEINVPQGFRIGEPHEELAAAGK